MSLQHKCIYLINDEIYGRWNGIFTLHWACIDKTGLLTYFRCNTNMSTALSDFAHRVATIKPIQGAEARALRDWLDTNGQSLLAQVRTYLDDITVNAPAVKAAAEAKVSADRTATETLIAAKASERAAAEASLAATGRYTLNVLDKKTNAILTSFSVAPSHTWKDVKDGITSILKRPVILRFNGVFNGNVLTGPATPKLHLYPVNLSHRLDEDPIVPDLFKSQISVLLPITDIYV